MRLIGMLLALLAIAFLALRPLTPETPAPAAAEVNTLSPTPAVPTRPGDIQQFDRSMDRFIQDQANSRAAAIEAAEGR